ncbi:hypothetical protein [Methyloversatilis universalis]|uniref:hypothetical protein n=1 Tax=Methyloversatilis universalis TaxID=378211 RepID=UPI0012FAA4BE|nr:hypothetical protein [Methyloversatilis universalis]
MKKLLLLGFALTPIENATAVVDQVQQQNAICYIKTNAPDLVFGQLPFSCNGKPEKFVAHVKKEINFLSQSKIIPNFDKCLTSLLAIENMTNIARGVWDLRDSPVMSTNAATASAILNACKKIEANNSPQTGNPSVRQKSSSTEAFPSYVTKTWSYKPFSILSTRQDKRMSDAYIANSFLCKTPTETLQATMDLLRNYDLVDTSKTDGTLTVTSFRGLQDGKNVTVSLAVDEQSNPRVVRYILVDGMPALNCQ